MGLFDLGIESANRVGKFNTNTKLTGNDLNATVLGMATTFCQVIQAFSQSRTNNRINPNDSSFLGMDLDDIKYTPNSNGGVLSIGKINPGILFHKNIPYIIPEITNQSFQLPNSSGKSFGLYVKVLNTELSDSRGSNTISSDGEEINISLPSKMSFPYKIYWEEITGENGELSPRVISSGNKIYIFTLTRSTSIGSFGWQLSHNSFQSPYVLDVNNTFVGRERKDGTLADLLSGIPESREDYYNEHDVGDIIFFHHEKGATPTKDFPFLKMSTPLTIINREEYPDFYTYLKNYKLPLRLYLDGWEWDALPFPGESEKQGTAYNFGALSMQRVKYGYNALEKKQYEDKASEGKKGTFGKCTFRIFLSKTKKTIFNTVTNTYLDNKLLLSIINDLPMHPVRFPDLSNLMLDNDPLSPLGSYTIDPEPNTLPRRNDAVVAQKVVEGEYFKVNTGNKPQSLSNDIRFRKVKGIVSCLKVDSTPELLDKDSIGSILNKMSDLLLETLGMQNNTGESRSLFLTAYNGNVSSISETDTHVIIEIDDFLYNEQLQAMEKFISKSDFGTTPYYLEFFPYRIPQTPYFERIPMNVPAHRQLYAPNPLSNSMIKELAFSDKTSYSIENNLNESGTAKRDVDGLGEDEARLRSAPPILKWKGNSIEVNYSGGGAPDRTLNLENGHPFRNGMRIPHQPGFVRTDYLHTYYDLGKTNGGLIPFKFTPTNGQNVSNVSGYNYNFTNSKLIISGTTSTTSLNSKAPISNNGFELKHPFFERVNRSSWWLLEGSNSKDLNLIRNKSLRSKVQYNQALKFFVPTQSVAPSMLPLAQKNSKKTLILTGHSQLGGMPKTGDTYERIITDTKLNITIKPPLFSGSTPKPELHGIILNMRHLRSPISNSTPSTYEYLYYIPKIPRYHHAYENNQVYLATDSEAVGRWAKTWELMSSFQRRDFRIDSVKTGETGKLCFLNSIPPRGGIPDELSYPKIGRFLRRTLYINDALKFDADVFKGFVNLTPTKNGSEVLTMVDNYVLVALHNEYQEQYNWGDVHPNIGLYLRISPESYDSGGAVNAKGLKELYLWHFYGILPAWWHTDVSIPGVPFHDANWRLTNPNYSATRKLDCWFSIIYPGWIIFGGMDDMNGNICIPPVAYTNTLYPNQVTSRNIALVFLSSVFTSDEVKKTSTYMGTKLYSRYFNSNSGFNNKIATPNFFSYQEETLSDPSHTAWGLSKEAYDALTTYTHEEDVRLIPEMVSLYWEDIRGTWLHDLYQEIGLNALFEKARVDTSNAPYINNSETDSFQINGDFSSLFMIGIDYSPEKIMKPGDTYAVYYPNQNALGSLSIDEYINTYLTQKISELKKSNANRNRKYYHIPYYGELPGAVKGLDGNTIIGGEPVRDWVFKQNAHTDTFFNFSAWIEYFRKCVREYASSNGVNGFDGLFHPAEQNVYGLITGGGIVKGKSNTEPNLDNLDMLRNGIPNNVNNAPQASPQVFLNSSIVVGNTKGGNEWNNPKLNFPHKKSEKMRREYEAFKTNTTKIGKMFPVSKMNGIPYIFVGRTLLGNSLPPTIRPPKGITMERQDYNFVQNESVSIFPIITEGTEPFNFVVTPSLPAGIQLNPVTGFISGTPSQPSAKKEYRLSVSNSLGTDYIDFTMYIEAVIPPNNLSYNAGQVAMPLVDTNVTYAPTLNRGNVSSPLTYSITPALPSGMSLNPTTGVITGKTPNSNDTTYTIRASNSAGSTSTTFRIRVIFFTGVMTMGAGVYNGDANGIGFNTGHGVRGGDHYANWDVQPVGSLSNNSSYLVGAIMTVNYLNNGDYQNWLRIKGNHVNRTQFKRVVINGSAIELTNPTSRDYYNYDQTYQYTTFYFYKPNSSCFFPNLESNIARLQSFSGNHDTVTKYTIIIE